MRPDIFAMGKPIAGGVPALRTDVRARCCGKNQQTHSAGGLRYGWYRRHARGKSAFAKMIPLAERFAAEVLHAIEAVQLLWHVSQLGCAEYLFRPGAPRNGGEAATATDFALMRFMHLYALNRDILLTPFHNMALMSPATSRADIDQHTRVFTDAAGELTRWI